MHLLHINFTKSDESYGEQDGKILYFRHVTAFYVFQNV